MRMIRLALIVCAMSFASISLRASDDVVFSPYARLISYDSLMRLQPANRELYLSELRVLLMEIEDLQDSRAPKDAEAKKRLGARLELLMALIQEANASGAVGRSTPRVPTSCQAGYKLVRIIPRSNPRCVVDPDAQARIAQQARNLRLLRAGLAEQEAWERAHPGQTRIPFARPRSQLPSEQSRALVATFSSIERRWPNLAPGNERMSRPPGGVIPRTAPIAARPGPARSAAPAGAPTRTRRTSAEPDRADRRQRAPAAAPDPEPVDIPPIAAVQECAIQEAAKTEVTCTRETVAEARSQITRQNPTCVYAGHVRRYRDPQPRAGRCQPINQWCLNEINPEDCRVPTDRAQSFTPVFGCSPSQILCNPVLFGMKLRTNVSGANRFQPYCVARGAHATRECYEQVTNPGTNEEHLDLNNLRAQGSGGARILEEVLTPEERERLSTQINQMPKMWNDLAENLSNMCINDDVERRFFCEECSFIRRRLVEMAFLTGPDLNIPLRSAEAMSACAQLVRVKSRETVLAERGVVVPAATLTVPLTIVAPADATVVAPAARLAPLAPGVAPPPPFLPPVVPSRAIQ